MMPQMAVTKTSPLCQDATDQRTTESGAMAPWTQMQAAVTRNSTAGRPYSRHGERGARMKSGGAGDGAKNGEKSWVSLTRDGLAIAQPELPGFLEDYCDRFWRSLPGLKRMVRPGGIFTSLPVRGLRPMPRLRGFTWKTPKPRSSIRSPRIKESFIASRTASTATSALTFVMSAAFETSLMMSTLIMRDGPPSKCLVL